jgi:hypothetical protein
VDPEAEWLHAITFRQSEQMCISQLENDNDVISQYEAIQGLRNTPNSTKTLEALKKALENPQLFFRVRIEAARALARVTNRQPTKQARTTYLSSFSLFFVGSCGWFRPADQVLQNALL